MALAALAGWEWILFIILMFLFLVAGGVTAFVILARLRWPFIVNVLQDVDGSSKLKVVSKDRARMVAFGDGGEEIFLLKKAKRYKVGYGKRIGNKAIAWAIGDDGYWYNVTFQGVDKRLLEVGVLPVDRDMRFATASVRKGLENRYNDRTWMDKYGTVLYFGLFMMTVLIFGGIMWFAFAQMGKITAANAESMNTAKEVMEIARETLLSIDNIRGGGSGLLPA